MKRFLKCALMVLVAVGVLVFAGGYTRTTVERKAVLVALEALITDAAAIEVDAAAIEVDLAAIEVLLTGTEAALEADGWTVTTIPINVAAGATTELVGTAGSGKKIRVVGLFGTTDVSGTITFKSAGDAISGVIELAAKSGPVMPAIPAQNIPLHGWCQTAANEALNITTVTCTFDGFLIYATED